MQNRYVGDIGDYGKYGLLRYLSGHINASNAVRLGVLWYLVSNETHNNDGAKTSYLSSDQFNLRACDPILYDELRRIVSRSDRDVCAISRAGLLPNAISFEQLLTVGAIPRSLRVQTRRDWLAAAMRTLHHAELVFFDPDNGLEAASAPIDSRTSHKYAYLTDVQDFVNRKQSVLVYHHICRSGTAKEQVLARLSQLRELAPATAGLSAFLCHRGSARAYLLLANPDHQERLWQSAAAFMRSHWREHFEWITLPGDEKNMERE